MAKKTAVVQTQVTDTTHVTKVSSAGAKVTVYCKYPLGIKLRTFSMVKGNELVMGGGSREVLQAQHNAGKDYVIKGPATEVNKRSAVAVIAGYAVNRGVPKDIWDAWLEDNKNTPLVKNNLIFAMAGDHGEDHGQAKELRKQRTGFEPLNPDNDPRKPRPSKTANVSEVKDEDGDHAGYEA